MMNLSQITLILHLYSTPLCEVKDEAELNVAELNVIHVAHQFATNTECYGWHICKGPPTTEEISQAEKVIIQYEKKVYSQEIDNILKGLSKDSSLYILNPINDHYYKLLQVRGRIGKSNLFSEEQNSLIIPGRHHITALLTQCHHKQVQQGQHFMGGAVMFCFWRLLDCGDEKMHILHPSQICQVSKIARKEPTTDCLW